MTPERHRTVGMRGVHTSTRGFSFSRPTAPELCCSHRLRKCRGRREGRVPAGTRGPLCGNCATNLHSGIQVKPNIRPSLRSGFTAYAELSPGSDALLPPSSCGCLMRAARSGRHITARLDAQAPGARTARFYRTQAAPVVCAQAVAHGCPPCKPPSRRRRLRPPRPIPRVVTIAITPLGPGWDGLL